MNPGLVSQTTSLRSLAHRAGFGRAQPGRRRSITATRCTRPSRRRCRGWAGSRSGSTPPRAPPRRRSASAPASRSWTRSLSWFRRAPSGRRSSTSARAARVRWKSARFVPLSVVQSILSGQARSTRTTGASMAPAIAWCPRAPGPFRTAVRSSAGVDRLTGASRAPFHCMHRIPPRRWIVDRGLVRG